MVILTHPLNKEVFPQIHKKALEVLNRQGILPSRSSGIPVVYTEKVSQYVKQEVKGKPIYDKFVTHEPTDWEIFCGFCEPNRYEDTNEPQFLFRNERGSIFAKPS